MMLSELIAELQKFHGEHGDARVAVDYGGIRPVEADGVNLSPIRGGVTDEGKLPVYGESGIGGVTHVDVTIFRKIT